MAIASNIDKIQYDINQSYGIDSSYIIAFLDEIKSIEQSIGNILITPIGSRPRGRDFGSALYRWLYKPMTSSNASLIMLEIYNAITNYEPRVIIIPSESEILIDLDNRQYEIQLAYVIVRSNEQRSYRFAVESSI